MKTPAFLPSCAAALLAFGAIVASGPAQAWEVSWGGGPRVVGSGKSATETRQVRDFQAISSRGSMNVVVRQSDHEAVQVKGDDNIVPLVETTLEGHTLVVAMKKGANISTRSDLVVTVDVIALNAISSSGSGDVRIESLKTPALKISLSGSSDAKLMSLRAGDLDISISGSGDVGGAGSAGRLHVDIAGSGDVRLQDLPADDVSVGIAGSGDAEVTANKTLKVSVAGSGDVTYHGAGALVKSSIAGSGSITHR